MKIVIPGGSGQVGTLLARHFQQKARGRYTQPNTSDSEPRAVALSHLGCPLARELGHRARRRRCRHQSGR